MKGGFAQCEVLTRNDASGDGRFPFEFVFGGALAGDRPTATGAQGRSQDSVIEFEALLARRVDRVRVHPGVRMLRGDAEEFLVLGGRR